MIVMRILSVVVVLASIALVVGHVTEVRAAAEAPALVLWQPPAEQVRIDLPALSMDQKLSAEPGKSIAKPARDCERIPSELSSWSPGIRALVGSASCIDNTINNYLGTDFAAYGVILSPNHATFGLPASAGALAHNLEFSFDTKQRMMLTFMIKKF